MNIMKYIPKSVTTTVGRSILKTKKNSPQLLFAAGVTGMVTSTVLACRATLKLEEVLSETNTQLDLARDTREHIGEKYSEADHARDRKIILVRGAVSVVKLYAPAIIIGSLSVAALTGSHRILNNRNAALSAAYAGIEKAFAEYRGRVREELGDEKDREFRFGSEEHTIVEDTNKGPKKETIKRHTSDGTSMYARLFDERNANWCNTPEYTIMFLRGQQTYANQRLQAVGHLLLNDVYDALGLERTKAGCVVGWIKGHGDDRVDFGIFDGDNSDRMYDFVTGREGAILLDFNVDGIIYDKI